jgi:hypothetical protein
VLIEPVMQWKALLTEIFGEVNAAKERRINLVHHE